MLLAYVDESGDPGKRKGATRTYTLGCVLVDADQWPKAFEDFLKFRRELRDEFKIRTSDEIKANYLLHDGGNVGKLGLSFDQKREIYQRHMHLVQTLRAQAFAVLIDKQLPKYRRAEPRAIVEVAWFYLAQRLERACRGGLISLMVIHDEGDNAEVRRCLRRARRNLWTQEHYGGAYRRLPGLPLVDDPVPRQSHHSYFTQMADLVAYAAYSWVFPPGQSRVCTEAMWPELGDAIRRKVNDRFGPGDGVVRD